MSHNPYIICGPKDDSDVPKQSMGKYLFDCLRKRGSHEIINIDAVTKEVLTCGQLLADSIKLITVFKAFSLEKGDVITIVSKNSIKYLVPIVAALQMGVTVNPLNPDYSTGELKHALLISRPKLVICSQSTLNAVLDLKNEMKFIKKVILMESKAEDLSETDNLENLLKLVSLDEALEPQDFDYTKQGGLILLSSGTTGLPKGVLLTHQNLRCFIVYMGHPNYSALTSQDITVQFLPFFHIFGIIIQLVAITSSMKVVLMSFFKPELFLKCVQEYTATKLYVVPAILGFLAKSPLIDKYDLSSIQDIICGAAPAAKELLIETSKRFRNVTVRQVYGLTETCGASIFQATNSTNVGSVGSLVPETMAKVWNSELKKLMGPLEVGELCFKGPIVMKEYVGNKTETQECIDSDGFFHSGDAGYYDSDNNFYIVGRLKELIKYKGFQVSPTELEGLIMTHPEVKDCGVVGIPNKNFGEVPCAFVVRKSNTNVIEEEIMDFVAERISVQKRLYGGVRFVENIPRTASGKILRRTLLEMFKS